MPDSDRGRLFTAVTAFFVATVVVLTGLAIWDGAASYTQRRLEAEHYAAEYAAESQERIEQCVSLANSADIAECISQVVGATREHQRGERDLAAQRDMAKWAGWLLIASGAGVWITLAGVIYVALTLQATRAAVAAANRTADEAKRIGEAQIRAYLSPSIEKFTLQGDGQNIFKFRMGLKNSGQSPALRVTHRTMCGIRETPLPQDHDFAQEIWPEENAFTLGVGDASRGDIHCISHEEFALVRSGKAFIYIAAIARYQDVFSNKVWHVTRHAYEFRRNPMAVQGPDYEFFGWGGETNNQQT